MLNILGFVNHDFQVILARNTIYIKIKIITKR